MEDKGNGDLFDDKGSGNLLEDKSIEDLLEEKSDKNKILGYIVKGLWVIDFGLLFFIRFDFHSDLFAFLFAMVTLLIYFIGWTITFCEKKSHRPSTNLIFLIRIIAIVLLSICLFIIFISDRYDLKYSYLLPIILFPLQLVISRVESLRSNYQKRKTSGEHYFILTTIGESLFNIILYGAIIIYIIHFFFAPVKQINLLQLEAPESIGILRIEADKLSSTNDIINHRVEISDQEDIEAFISDLRGKTVTSIHSTTLMNHIKMREKSEYRYVLIFHYKNGRIGKNQHKDKYIDTIEILSNGSIIIKSLKELQFPFYRRREEIYPIQLSEETIDMLTHYIDQIQGT